MNYCDWLTPSQTRKIKPTRRSMSGVVSFRGKKPIPYESTLERDFLLRTSFFLDVLDIVPQPVFIPFVARNGRQYTYTPDYLVWFRGGSAPYSLYPKPMLIEVKPEKEWRRHWRKWLPKWKAAHAYAREQGWVFHIYDESRIRGDQAMDNILFLERYKQKGWIYPEEDNQLILKTVEEMGCAPVHYILTKWYSGNEWRRAEGLGNIWHLIATRRLDCDIHRPLNEDTEVWIPCYD